MELFKTRSASALLQRTHAATMARTLMAQQVAAMASAGTGVGVGTGGLGLGAHLLSLNPVGALETPSQ